MLHKFGCLTFALFLTFALSGCGQADSKSEIAVRNAWIRPAEVGGPTTGAYMTIENTGGGSDRLLSVSAEFAEAMQIHETQITDGVARMIHQENGVEVPANSTVEFDQGGLHLMIMSVTEDIALGDFVTLSLNFEKAGTITVEAIARQSPVES